MNASTEIDRGDERCGVCVRMGGADSQQTGATSVMLALMKRGGLLIIDYSNETRLLRVWKAHVCVCMYTQQVCVCDRETDRDGETV